VRFFDWRDAGHNDAPLAADTFAVRCGGVPIDALWCPTGASDAEGGAVLTAVQGAPLQLYDAQGEDAGPRATYVYHDGTGAVAYPRAIQTSSTWRWRIAAGYARGEVAVFDPDRPGGGPIYHHESKHARRAAVAALAANAAQFHLIGVGYQSAPLAEVLDRRQSCAAAVLRDASLRGGVTQVLFDADAATDGVKMPASDARVYVAGRGPRAEGRIAVFDLRRSAAPVAYVDRGARARTSQPIDAAFLADGRGLITASCDGDIMVYDAAALAASANQQVAAPLLAGGCDPAVAVPVVAPATRFRLGGAEAAVDVGAFAFHAPTGRIAVSVGARHFCVRDTWAARGPPSGEVEASSSPRRGRELSSEEDVEFEHGAVPTSNSHILFARLA
jgi:hypothetical protein